MKVFDINEILNDCFMGGLMIVVLLVAIKWIRSHVAKLVEIPATVVDKRTSTYTKYSPVPEQATDYILVFKSGEKRLSFFTSIWVYDSVKKGDRGTLKYKGNHLIGFERK